MSYYTPLVVRSLSDGRRPKGDYPYGGNRGGSAFSGVTTKRFTGQYHEQGLPGGEGLAFYNARWYDAQVGVFISADTLVPSPLAPRTFRAESHRRCVEPK